MIRPTNMFLAVVALIVIGAYVLIIAVGPSNESTPPPVALVK